MHPKALLEACSELVRLTLRFEHPADATVSRFGRAIANGRDEGVTKNCCLTIHPRPTATARSSAAAWWALTRVT
jgi:hypothetical protein